MQRNRSIGALAAAASLALASPALAQEAALDALADASTTPGGALAAAQRQSAAGDLLGAAATLERALIAQPNAHKVRQAYAALLCRLDDRQAARLELERLARSGTGGADWDAVRAACGADAARAPTASKLSGHIALGLAYDSDAYSETLVQFAGLSAAADGLAAVASARLDGRLALGDQTFGYGAASGITKHSLAGTGVDYQYGEALAGLGLSIGAGEIATGGVLRYGRIDNARYVTEYGGQLRLSFPQGASSRLTVVAEALRQDFYDPQRDGWLYGASLSYSGRASESIDWFLSGQGEVKSAAFPTIEYATARLTGGLRVRLNPRGTYASVRSSLRYVDYGDEPLFPARSDWQFYNRAALGVPLGASGLVLEGAVSHSYRDYNAVSLLDDYSSIGGELRLIWNFGGAR